MPNPFQRRDGAKNDLTVAAPTDARQAPLAQVGPPPELALPPEASADPSAEPLMSIGDVQQMIRDALNGGLTPEEVISQIMAVGNDESEK